MIQFLYRNQSTLPRAPHVMSQRRVVRACYRIAALERCIVTQSRPPHPRYKFLYRGLLLARPCARVLPYSPRAGRPCRRPHPTISQACSAVSWSCPGWPSTPLRACVLLCHDTVCCIVTKPGNWAVAHSSSCNFFFFTSFFFHLFHLLEDHKKIFFFHFPIELKKFILNILFPVLHTVKPHKFFFFNTVFFPMCYSPSTQITQHTQQSMFCTPFTHKTQCMQCSNPCPSSPR